ncbi:DNA polymerase III subunit chi [Alphaproteobacteria bacterium]|nr:DNA polymerase III subunit chi [Alphaproteobacteria bacterium]
MTQVIFYQLTSLPVERALPKVLEKVIEAGFRVHVLTPDEARTADLNKALWTYHPQSFLPHGSAVEGNPTKQPIWLSHKRDHENGAQVLALVDNVFQDELGAYDKCLYFFSQQYTPGRAKAKEHWQALIQKGYSCTMWLQKATGSWEKSTQFVEEC